MPIEPDDVRGGHCFTKSCNGRMEEVEITDEHKERSSHGGNVKLHTVMECTDCECTRYFYRRVHN